MEDGEAEVARAAAAAEREERERQAMRSLFVQLAGRADNAVYKSEEWAVLSKVATVATAADRSFESLNAAPHKD